MGHNPNNLVNPSFNVQPGPLDPHAHKWVPNRYTGEYDLRPLHESDDASRRHEAATEQAWNDQIQNAADSGAGMPPAEFGIRYRDAGSKPVQDEMRGFDHAPGGVAAKVIAFAAAHKDKARGGR